MHHHMLIERDYDTINGFWSGCHILLLTLGTISSMVCVVLFHILIAAFDMNCILNPKSIKIANDSSHNFNRLFLDNITYKRTDLPIDFMKSQWSNDNACYGSLYNPLLSVIFGIVWLTFFLMCSNSGRSISGLMQPWRIILPFSLFTFVYSILSIVVSEWLTDGLNNFISQLNNISAIDNIRYFEVKAKIAMLVLMTITSSWIYTACWIISFFMIILRCIVMPDFKLVKINVEIIKEVGNVESETMSTDGSVNIISNPMNDYPSTSALIH